MNIKQVIRAPAALGRLASAGTPGLVPREGNGCTEQLRVPAPELTSHRSPPGKPSRRNAAMEGNISHLSK